MSVSQSSRTANTRINKKRSRSQAGLTRSMFGGSVSRATKDVRWAFAFILLLVTAADASTHHITRRLVTENGSGKAGSGKAGIGKAGFGKAGSSKATSDSNIFDRTSKDGGKGMNKHNSNVFDRKSSKGKKQGKANKQKAKKAKTPAPSEIAPTSAPTDQVTPMPSSRTTTAAPSPATTTAASTPTTTTTAAPSPTTTTAAPTPTTTTTAAPSPTTTTAAPTTATAAPSPTTTTAAPTTATAAPSPTTTTAAPSPTTTTAAPSPTTTSAAPSPLITTTPTAALVVAATPFTGAYVNAAANPTMAESTVAAMQTCEFLSAFFMEFYSLSFETILASFDCSENSFGTDPAQISYDVSFVFEEGSFLIPTPEEVDLLLATAFQPPSVDALLVELNLSAGAFASTTAVEYSVSEASNVFAPRLQAPNNSVVVQNGALIPRPGLMQRPASPPTRIPIPRPGLMQGAASAPTRIPRPRPGQMQLPVNAFIPKKTMYERPQIQSLGGAQPPTGFSVPNIFAPSPTATTHAPTRLPTTDEPSPAPSLPRNTAEPSRAPTTGTVVIGIPFSGAYVNTEGNPTMEEVEETEQLTCAFIRDFFVEFFSFSFDSILESFDCNALTFVSDPSQISFEVSFGFAEGSFLVPIPEDLDLLLETAFQPPVVNALLEELSFTAGTFASTIAVDYSTAVVTDAVFLRTRSVDTEVFVAAPAPVTTRTGPLDEGSPLAASGTGITNFVASRRSVPVEAKRPITVPVANVGSAPRKGSKAKTAKKAKRGQTATPTTTQTPTQSPTTSIPTQIPTTMPSTMAPTAVPTAVPTEMPTAVPTEMPTAIPTAVPTALPTAIPTAVPTTALPTMFMPTVAPFARISKASKMAKGARRAKKSKTQAPSLSPEPTGAPFLNVGKAGKQVKKAKTQAPSQSPGPTGAPFLNVTKASKKAKGSKTQAPSLSPEPTAAPFLNVGKAGKAGKQAKKASTQAPSQSPGPTRAPFLNVAKASKKAKGSKTQAPSLSPEPTGAPFLNVGKAGKQANKPKTQAPSQSPGLTGAPSLKVAKASKKGKKGKSQAPSQPSSSTSVPTAPVQSPSTAPAQVPSVGTTAPMQVPSTGTTAPTRAPSTGTTAPTRVPSTGTTAPTRVPSTGTVAPAMAPSPTTTAVPSPAGATPAPAPSPTGSMVVPATPFSGGYINAGADPTVTEFEDAELQTCAFLRDFFVEFYSFSFETILVVFDCAAVTFGSGPAQISYEVSLTFAETSFLIPTQEDVDILLTTAFQPPSVNPLLVELNLSGGAFASTTAVDYSTTVSAQSFMTVQSMPEESSGTTFVAGAFVIFIAGIFIVKRRGDRSDQTQSGTASWGQQLESLLDPEDYQPESHAILGRMVNQPMPGQGYMGFDEAIEIDFVPSDEHEPLGASRNALFKRPFLVTPFGGERFGSERRASFTPCVAPCVGD